jgi:Ni,Fe-hydrogenase III large subunit
VEAIAPVPYPSNQQAIRVIREEVDRIEMALTEIISR